MTDTTELVERERARLLVQWLHQMTVAELVPITLEDLSDAPLRYRRVVARNSRLKDAEGPKLTNPV